MATIQDSNRTIYQEYIRYQLKEISIDVARVLVLIPVSELHLISRQHVRSPRLFSEFRHGEIQAEEGKKEDELKFFFFFFRALRTSTFPRRAQLIRLILLTRTNFLLIVVHRN